ncbi:MAG: OmpA family protein [Cryomorphaceae bacterium]|jgi:outer membrane protein OmpA-like peptidoglycan-associated protein|nr:OmpA family protein [Cryomorphaceae bacterium]
MRSLTKIFFSLIFFFPVMCQSSLIGIWQGIMIKDGSTIEQSSILFADIKVSSEGIEGKTRDELYNTDQYAVKRFKGTANQNSITFKQSVIERKKSSSKTNWCLISATLFYSDSSGYLEGRYTSTDCKRNTGKIILYRSTASFSESDTSAISHAWFKPFIYNFKKGYAAPEKLELERKNFTFQPVYFDHDKAEIRSEYTDFLVRMVRVVDGHSDLRIRVTGHTDSDGSDAYNVELSKRRAKALIDFFVDHGLSEDRIEIDFRGEKDPVDNNSTPEGKQKNRRVDFSFI